MPDVVGRGADAANVLDDGGGAGEAGVGVDEDGVGGGLGVGVVPECGDKVLGEIRGIADKRDLGRDHLSYYSKGFAGNIDNNPNNRIFKLPYNQ